MQEEIWKKVIGYEDRYEVSNIGRVRSIGFYMNNSSNGKSFKKGRILKQCSASRYARVGLCRDRKMQSLCVHRLVAIAFIPNHENKPQVNHINGIRTDNRVENLEWCTASENQLHALKNGLKKVQFCENHSQSKFRNIDVINIRKMIQLGKKLTEIAEDYGVSIATISNIKHGKNWFELK